MKKALLIGLLAFAFAGGGDGVSAQEGVAAKDLFLIHAANPGRGKPGVKIQIILNRNGERRFVQPDYRFLAGDKVKFRVETNFHAYVAILNLGPTGRLQKLFPFETDSRRGIREVTTVPRGDSWFEFVDSSGIAKLTLIFSSEPFLVDAGEARSPGATGAEDAKKSDDSLSQLESLALENGRDLNLVQPNPQEIYVLSDGIRLRKPTGLRINLQN